MPGHFGEELKKLRHSAEYETLGSLSRASRVAVSTLSRIEAGTQRPTPATLKKLAPCLGVSYEHLMAMAGYLPPPGQLIAVDERGVREVFDIDQLLADDACPIRLGGRVISPEIRSVLKENLNLIKRLIAAESKKK